MPLRNQAVTVNLVCWNTVNNIGKTGDAANITVRGSRDGTLFTPSAPSITQMDATNMPGVYKVSLTAGENDGAFVTLGGISSTASCVIIPISWANELTGDSFARLGAPAGASISADIATRLATAGYTAPPTTGDIATAVWAAGTRTLSSFGTLVSDVATAVWGAGARTLTAISDSSGVTTLLTRIGTALSFTGANVHVHIKAKDNLDFGALEKTSLNAATPAVTVSDKTGFALSASGVTAVQAGLATPTNITGGTITTVTNLTNAPTNGDLTATMKASVTTAATASTPALSAAGVTAIVTGIWNALTSGLTTASSIGKLLVDNINATISSRSTYGGGDTAGTTTLLSRIASALTISGGNVTVGTNNDKTGYSLATAPPTVAQIRTELATELGRIDAAISTRLATAGYTAPANADITAIKAKTDNLPASPANEASLVTIAGYIDTEVAAIKTVTDKLDTAVELDGAVYRLTTNALELAPTGGSAPTVAQIRTEMDANSTKLANLDAAISTRLATAGYTAPANADITAIKGKTDTLNFTGSFVQAQVRGQDNIDFGALQKASLNAATPAVTVSDKTGFALSTAGVTAVAAGVWNALTSGLSTVGSIGKLLVDNINAAISTRSTYAGGDTAGTTTLLSRIASALTISGGKVTVGTNDDKTGYSLATAPPTAAQIRTELATELGRIDAAVSTRLAAASYTAPANADITAIKAKTDNLPASPAAVGSEMVLTAAYDAAKTAATQASINVIDNIVDKIDSALVLDGSVYQFTANALELAPTGGSGSAPTVEQIRTEMDANSTKLANLDAAISTRLATSGYTAPANADISAIKAKTDTIPVSPATEAKQDTIIGYIDTEIAAILAAVDTEVAAIKAKTDNIPVSPAAVGSAMVLTAAYDAAKTAASQASVNAIPTTPLLAASYTAPANADIAAIKAKTDQLAFTAANQVDANIKSVNDTLIQGDGSATPWGPV